ncbi:MAG: Nitrate reductase cytochrome c550-type subunit [uncultured Sulfurovum sp.]|uniref:Periplasmic nitrate reductase, electron transfer subunit n=1 Tax=uncultured Sulfurovum sp. TaxID=269237 RepID=A0A6S6S7H1_9BACT|nr:MAG: Nitrate reductase cytochrome c550-type subunit [uncultured Sulfurovum sp.]
MRKLVKKVALATLVITGTSYAANVAGCTACHGQNFEKRAMGKSKVVKDMSLEEITASLKGYKAGIYGDTMKQMMVSQVENVSDADLEAMAKLIKINPGIQTEHATGFAAAAAVVAAGGDHHHINLNENASNDKRIVDETLSSKKAITEESLGLRKTDLYHEDNTTGDKADYDRPAPGSSTKFERAFKDAPPMIPHSVEGLLPITKMNNQCLGCHLPEVAPSVGSTPIPATHFTNYRPDTTLKKDMVLKEGQVLGMTMSNTSDIVVAEAKKGDTLYQGRFNCTQCHAPQSKTETAVANTFRPDFANEGDKEHSTLADVMNEGIDYEVEEKTLFLENE